MLILSLTDSSNNNLYGKEGIFCLLRSDSSTRISKQKTAFPKWIGRFSFGYLHLSPNKTLAVKMSHAKPMREEILRSTRSSPLAEPNKASYQLEQGKAPIQTIPPVSVAPACLNQGNSHASVDRTRASSGIASNTPCLTMNVGGSGLLIGKVGVES